MTLNDQKCAFSVAWLRAVAAASGFGMQGGTQPDDQSVDITVTSKLMGISTKPRLDVQLKCTADDIVRGNEIKFPLPQNNYDDLRDPQVSVPIILVVLHVPKDTAAWLLASDEKLEMYRAAWWASLRGFPPTDNDETTTVSIPRSNILMRDALRGIMSRIADGQLP